MYISKSRKMVKEIELKSLFAIRWYDVETDKITSVF